MTFDQAIERVTGNSVARFIFCCVLAAVFAAHSLHRSSANSGAFVVEIVGPTTGRFAERTREIEIGVRAALQASPNQVSQILLRSRDIPCTQAAPGDKASSESQVFADVMIGHPCVRPALRLAARAAQVGSLFVSPNIRHPDLVDLAENTTTLRFAGRDDREGRAAGRQLAQLYAAKDVVVLQDRTKFAKKLARDIAQAWPLPPSKKGSGLDGGAVGDVGPRVLPLIAGEVSYDALVRKVALAAPKAVYLATFPAEAETLVRQFRAAGSKAIFWGPAALAYSTQRRGLTAVRDLQQIRVGLPADLTRQEVGKALVKRLQAQGIFTSDTLLRAFVAMEAILWTVSQTPERKPETTVLFDKILSAKRIPTSIGPISFGADQDVDLPSFTFQTVADWRLKLDPK